jgi:hypothetical protein
MPGWEKERGKELESDDAPFNWYPYKKKKDKFEFEYIGYDDSK